MTDMPNFTAIANDAFKQCLLDTIAKQAAQIADVTAAVAVLKASRDHAREAASQANARADKLAAENTELLAKNIDLRRAPVPMDVKPEDAGVETGSA